MSDRETTVWIIDIADGFVRQMRPHLFASSDRGRDLADLVFASSDRTR
jgi:hypothetical protein